MRIVRTTEDIAEQLVLARRTGEVVVLTGNTDDVLVDRQGVPWDSADFVAVELGRIQTVVTWSPAQGASVSGPDNGAHVPALAGECAADDIRALADLATTRQVAVIIDFADHVLPATPTTADDPDRLAVIEVLQRLGRGG